MKKILFVILCSVLFFTNNVFAAEYTTETLTEACEKEGLECKHTDKAYDSTLPTVYIFRGDGCPYCNNLLSYVSSIIDNYKLNVVVYEVKLNKDNWDLYKKVGAKFNFVPKGYPYMVVGDETFDGYINTYDEDIKTKFASLQDKTEFYDVVQDVLDDPVEENNGSNAIVIIFIFAVVAIIGAIFGYRVITKEETES